MNRHLDHCEPSMFTHSHTGMEKRPVGVEGGEWSTAGVHVDQ